MRIRPYIPGLGLVVLLSGAVYAFRFASDVAIWYSGVPFLQVWGFFVIGIATAAVLLVPPTLRRLARRNEIPNVSQWRLLGVLLLVLVPGGLALDALVAPQFMSWPTAWSVGLAAGYGLTAGLWEEAWRGIALSMLGGRERPYFAVAVTSVLFGAAHVFAWSWYSLAHASITMCIGVVLSVALLLGARLWHAMFAHALINVVAISYLEGDYFFVHAQLDAMSFDELSAWLWVGVASMLAVAAWAIVVLRRNIGTAGWPQLSPSSRPGRIELGSAAACAAIVLAASIDWFAVGGPLANRVIKRCADDRSRAVLADGNLLVEDNGLDAVRECADAYEHGNLSIRGFVDGS